MSGILGLVVDAARTVSDAGVRLFVENAMAVPKLLTRARLEGEAAERWVALDRELATISSERDQKNPELQQAVREAQVIHPPAPAAPPAYRGGWGPMP